MNHGEEVYEEAMKRFDYNPLTGDIIYIENTRRNKIGDVAGSGNGYGYLVIDVPLLDKKIRAHRLAFYIMEGYLPEQVDHMDGDRRNNKWLNLRGCIRSENNTNLGMRSDNTSGYRGVSKCEGKWRGSVMISGKHYREAGFATIDLANDWVVAKSKELYGEFYNENRNKEVEK